MGIYFMALVTFDHFVLAAATLEDGVAFVKANSGVDIPYGGEHPKMGTHNHLMRVHSRDEKDDYFFEVIAVNPNAIPERPQRWFRLADESFLKSLKDKGPRLVTWAVRTYDIEEVVKRSLVSLGTIETVTRGDLTWQITVPEDGSVPEGGIFPTVIQWPEGVRPWEAMADLGSVFLGLNLGHPNPEFIRDALARIGLGDTRINISSSENYELGLEMGERFNISLSS